MPTKRSSLSRPVLVVSLVSVMIPAIASAQSGGHRPPLHFIPAFSPTAFALTVDPTDTPAVYPDHSYWGDRARAWKAWQGLMVRLRHPVRQVEASAPAAPPPSAVHGGSADWYAIAACESGGRWDINSGNGYWGGLQFDPGTWLAYGGGPFDGEGPFPYSASEQIAVAERVLAAQGPSAWPNCFRWG